MKIASVFPIHRLRFAVVALLFTWGIAPVFAQENDQQNERYLGGLVEDWSHHHAIFSNPGTEEDAVARGRHEEWQHIVNNRRYLMQQIRRNRLWPGWKENSRDKEEGTEVTLQRDWTVTLGSGLGNARFAYPAKYAFAPVGTPSCTKDFVIYPIDASGTTGVLGLGAQANLMGVNNLYKTTCTGTVPSVLFAYVVGPGVVQTAPVLSEDGTKVAFVESITGGSVFHVLKLATTGSNGTSYNAPAVPGTGNNAVNTIITMSGNVSVTRSSPFVDYQRDIAYVGDDTGHLHKFTGVFQGTPAEVTSGWPIAVDSANSPILTGPVFDGGTSQSIFVGGSYGTANNGNGIGKIYCITLAGAACSTPSITVGTGIQDAPIVDSTNETIFVTAYNTSSTNNIVAQTPVSLASVVITPVGQAAAAMVDGAFDNAYYTKPSTGHYYVCGDGASGTSTATSSVLYRIGFNSSGTMNSTNDGNSYTLVTTSGSNTCSPLTEIFNGSTDYLFLSVPIDGAPSNCLAEACVMNFNITSSFPTAPIAALPVGGLLGASGDETSGIIIDNVSTTTGASQIYFINPNASTGVQASQAGLQ